MSYTHKWNDTKDISVEDWNKITKTVNRMIELEIATGVSIVGGMGDRGTIPEVDNEEIYLNGEEKDGCETLYIKRTGNESFVFCKTARKPYDKLVVAVLTIIDDLGYTTLSSDGTAEELKEGVEFGRRIFSEVNEDTDTLETTKPIKEIIESVTVNVKERILFNDINNPESGWLIWNYGAIFCIMDENMIEIDTFNIPEAMDRAVIEAEKHFKNVKDSLDCL